MSATFRGGIRFPASLRTAKQAACRAPLTVLVPESITLPLIDRGVLLTPCVSDGDTVGVGDRLAHDPQERVPPLHSGLSGRLQWRENSTLTVDGNACPLLTVIGDGQQSAGQLLPALSHEATPSLIVQRLYDAGIVGLGGAGFPTFRKYRGICAHHLLINACECEPFLAADAWQVLNRADSVRDGVWWLMRAAALSSEQVILCAEEEAVFQALRQLADANGWRAVQLSKRYPQGSEKQLIARVLKQEISHDSHPAACGIAVSNLSTAVAVADAARGLPLTHRVVTVSGAAAHPGNVQAPIGTSLRVLAATAEPLVSGRRSQLILGGPMTGLRVANADAGLPKACGGITILPAPSGEESPCIRCGTCVRVCPSGLMPFLIDKATETHEVSLCHALRADACIGCGSCSYVCPAHRPLAARIYPISRKETSP